MDLSTFVLYIQFESLRYFVDHDLNPWPGILPLIENSNFKNNLVQTDIFQEIGEIDEK